ncbi:beta strand repeat-containing protein [Leptospira idonii]|uniref:beta strand repeat-containing protein n=1 Tax=Leptospira idonii TaxID=1193500 RepID=UPI001FE86E99|nr:hypothetical protein [Leptospira idonii]
MTIHRLTIITLLFLSFSCSSVLRPNLLLLFGSFFQSGIKAGSLIYDADVYLFTSESGRVASFEVSLNQEPSSAVLIGPISTSDSTEGAVISDTYIEFTPSNWFQSQTILIKGVDDVLSDGNIAYNITFGSFSTEDKRFQGQPLPVVSLVNTDDETSGVAVNPTTGLLTSESGLKARIYYVLQTRPMRPVTIRNFASSVVTEATAPNTELVFTYENWNVPQYIEITGVDDFSIDGPQNYIISAGLTVSEDPSYNGKSVPIATGTNADNDSAGFTVVSLNSPVTTEAGGTASFAVVMNTIPTGNVTISSLVASPATEGVVSPSSLVFTPSNWNTPQTVTITGLDDFEADGNQTVTIVVSAGSSSDTNYNGYPGPVFPSVTNMDDDTRGFIVSPSTAVTFSENGGSQIFTFRLNSRPPAGTTVTIAGIASSLPGLVSVSPTTLVFTPANWNVPQNITASGINNAIDEDTRVVNLSFGSVDTSSGSRDTGYDSVSLPSSIAMSVTDDDTAGFTVTPVSGLVVDENAGPFTTTFTVVLNSQPTNNVQIPSITSSDTSEITVSPSSLTFTTANWNSPQTVTLTSVIDGTLDGDRSVTITLANATSSDAKYSGHSVPSVSAQNIDSGAPKVVLQNISSALSMVEDGTSTITFEIRLSILPGSSVTIGPITSSDTSEAVILDSSGNPTSSRSLTFTTTTGGAGSFTDANSSSGWNVAQTITIRSVADDFADGTIPVNINIPLASGSFYTGLRPDVAFAGYNTSTGNLTVSITDNDTKGFTLSATTLNLTEGGMNGTFTVRLNSAPCNTPANLENCTAGSVTIPLSSETFNAPDVTQYTFSPSSLTFTEADWNTPQTVTIVPSNDDYDEISIRSHTFTLGAITGSGTDYEGMNPSDVTINITDDDNPSPKVNFALRSGFQAFTAENGLQTTYQIRLATSPLVGNTVTVTVATTNGNEGKILDSTGPDVLVNSKVYTFDSTNWSTSVDVIIRGQPDNGDSADVAYTITVGSGTESGTTPSWYNSFVGATGTTANLTNYDIGANKVTIAAPSLTRAENSSAFTVYVFLQQEPTGNVTIPLSTSTAYPCQLIASPTVNQFAISPASLSINASNWNVSGTHNQFTVTPNDDAVNDGTITCPIQIGALTSSDAYYSGYDPTDLNLTLTDNDTSGFLTSNSIPSPLLTSESGASATFDLRLTSQPVDDITVQLDTTPSGIAGFSPSTLTFTPTNYGTVQTVTITGQDIGSSGDQNYTASISATSSETSTGGTGSVLYKDLSAATLNVKNIELLYDIVPCTTAVPASSCVTSPNAGGGLVSSPALTTTELGGQARFQVRLRARPNSTVTIPVASSNTAEGTVSVASLSFTTSNWNTMQEVIITGIDDSVADGNIIYAVNLGPMAGGGSGFNGQTLPSVSITNNDNDTASIIVTPTSGLVTTEAGGTAFFTVRLGSEPTSIVTIPLSSSNTAEGTIAVTQVQFDANCPGADCWSTPKVVTITGVDDFITDGNIVYTIITDPAVSADTNYNNMNASNVSVTNMDDD